MAVTAQGSGTKTPALGTFTVTLASPAVFSYTAHGLTAGDKVVFSTTGALPTGLTAGTTYFVLAAGLTANAFEVSLSDGGSAVNTSVSQSGTHSLVAEEILLDVNVAGTFTLHVDTVNMASGDVVELRAYQMVLTGGTRRVAYFSGQISGAQVADDLIKISVPISNELTDAGALRFTLKQTFGTARALPWKCLKYA
jgi:hypothetical protein